jgi:hypothetical protein
MRQTALGLERAIGQVALALALKARGKKIAHLSAQAAPWLGET